MAIFYPKIEPVDSKLDVCVKGGFLTPEHAEHLAMESAALNDSKVIDGDSCVARDRLLLSIERTYNNVLKNMRNERTIVLKALFYGATHEEITLAIEDPKPMALLRLLSTARRRYEEQVPAQDPLAVDYDCPAS